MHPHNSKFQIPNYIALCHCLPNKHCAKTSYIMFFLTNFMLSHSQQRLYEEPLSATSGLLLRGRAWVGEVYQCTSVPALFQNIYVCARGCIYGNCWYASTLVHFFYFTNRHIFRGSPAGHPSPPSQGRSGWLLSPAGVLEQNERFCVDLPHASSSYTKRRLSNLTCLTVSFVEEHASPLTPRGARRR